MFRTLLITVMGVLHGKVAELGCLHLMHLKLLTKHSHLL